MTQSTKVMGHLAIRVAWKSILNKKEAVAFGVFGLDGAHSSTSELHPVFGLAIHIKTT